MSTPEEDVDAVEDAKKDESPLDRVDNDLLASGGELEDHGAEKEQMDQGPDVKGIVRRGNVGRLFVSPDRLSSTLVQATTRLTFDEPYMSSGPATE
jgi:hypothetical protein